MALPKENRLINKSNFDIIFKEGNAVKGNFLFIKYRKSDSYNPRFALIIPKKIIAGAVDRNKLKRFLSELIRLNLKNIQGSYDLVIVVNKKEKNDILGAELLNLFRKISILK